MGRRALPGLASVLLCGLLMIGQAHFEACAEAAKDSTNSAAVEGSKDKMLIDLGPLENVPPLDGYFDLRDQLKRHIYGRSFRAFDAGDRDRDNIKTVEELGNRTSRMREAFIEAIGGLPPMDTPLNARKCGEIDEDGFRIEKVIFESRPKTFVTANVYIPDGITEPRGAVLFLCGHALVSKSAEKYQTVCRAIVKTGLVVMIQDPVGQGERLSYWDPDLGKSPVGATTRDHDHAGMQSLPLGDSICRYFIHDAMRGIDYLMSRPEVDPNRIGVTGSSGGGTQTCLMMICDPRIAAAAPGTFVMNRRSYMLTGGPQDQEQIWLKMTSLGFDHEDVLLMMAPKPVRILAVKWDFFPIEGTRRTVERCKRFWEMSGSPGKLDMVEDESTHAYTRPLAKAAAEFFSEHLLGTRITPDDAGLDPIEGSKLWCTQSGQVRGEIEGARFVYDENVDRLDQIESERAAMPEDQRRDRAVSWLRERVAGRRTPHPLNPRFVHEDTVQELRSETGCWWSQEEVLNFGLLFRHTRDDGKKLPVTVAVWDGGCSSLNPHAEWLRETCESGRAVMVLNLSGVGKHAPHQIGNTPLLDFYGTVYLLSDHLYWLDDSMVAMRVHDVLRALDMIEEWKGIDSSDIRFYGSGLHSVYPRLAAVLDERIRGVELAEDAFTSWADWIRSRFYEHRDILSVIMPGSLKYFDLPDADRWAQAR